MPHEREINEAGDFSRNDYEDKVVIAPLLSEEPSPTDEIEDITKKVDDLELFRENWQYELQKKQIEQQSKEENDLETARAFFMEGVECEKKGDMCEAVRHYTKAVRLVPDIERKVTVHASQVRQRSKSRSRGPLSTADTSDTKLIEHFSANIVTRGVPFLSSTTDVCLFNTLPTELLRLILRYVIGSSVDCRSFCNLSLVSSNFYLLTREDDIWRSIINRSSAALEKLDNLSTWQQTFIKSPHLLFCGVYASKSSYIRHGEASFQDSNFRPWFTVSYFRLIRFFADGRIMMTTTSEQPSVAVSLFNTSQTRPDCCIMFGNWWMEDGDVHAKLIRNGPPVAPRLKKTKKTREVIGHEYGVLHHESSIILRFHPRKQNKFSLVWVENVMKTTFLDGSQSVSDLEADKDSQGFPPLRFYNIQAYSDIIDEKLP